MLGDGCCIVLIKGCEAYCRGEEVISVILFRSSLQQSDDETKVNLLIVLLYLLIMCMILLFIFFLRCAFLKKYTT